MWLFVAKVPIAELQVVHAILDTLRTDARQNSCRTSQRSLMNSKENAQTGEVCRNDPAFLLMYLQHIPFELILLLLGKTKRPFLADMFGLSPSHLRVGKNSKLRESTQKRIFEFAEKKCRAEMKNKGWSEAQIDSFSQSSPSKLSVSPRPYSDLIYILQVPGELELPLTIAFADEVDRFVIRLLEAHSAGDLGLFKQEILGCNWGDGVTRSIADRHEAVQRMEAFKTASSWEDALDAAQQVFENILLCLFAALDAEHGLTYFGIFQPRPLFLLVQPKLNPQLKFDSLEKLPLKNFVYHPVRRLLELSHALMVWSIDKHWPDKPVGRKELGDAIDRADFDVGKFFDGTRKMNVGIFEEIWSEMSRTIGNRKPFYFPKPLVLAAILWQNCITRDANQKIKNVLLPSNDENYISFWRWHHQNWATQPKHDSVGWPVWLGDQPSRPSSEEVLSSQSSGRSSSSRECQYSSLFGLS